ncbi:MAG: hypothetical protein IJT00_10545 [Lachnospiraceae bacterium]|nr:hypothetical protein [Lachnospiraceae bacterium]
MEAKIKGKIAEEETKRAVSEKRWLYISMTVFIIGLFVMCIFLIVYESSDDKKKEVQKQALMSSAEAANVTLITSHYSSGDYADEDYASVKEDLEKLGFTNVTALPEKSSIRPGAVTSVKADGEYLRRDETYPADAEIIVRYRAKKLFDQ